MNPDQLLYCVALKYLDGIGPTRARALVSHAGGVREVFVASLKELSLAEGVGQRLVMKMNREAALKKAEQELSYTGKLGLKAVTFLDKNYPRRLSYCSDAPLVLYAKGEVDFNSEKVISVVGTRNATPYGKRMVDRLIEGLKVHNPVIVSGLALGIDGCAHRAALTNGLRTIAVLGHSLDRIYPSQHRSLAAQITTSGALVTEFGLETKPDRENFPMRNRIVAGIADATLVVETGAEGGSMITARLASDYNRDVFAVPGPVDAPWSTGCNLLIKTNRAVLVESAADIEYQLGWERKQKVGNAQKQMFIDLDEHERLVVEVLKKKEREMLDNISLEAGLPVSQTSTILLELEFKGVVRCLPGKVYCLN
ncbi:MAG: DNA-processing protein DprA [Salibacteraceae bacterium]